MSAVLRFRPTRPTFGRTLSPVVAGAALRLHPLLVVRSGVHVPEEGKHRRERDPTDDGGRPDRRNHDNFGGLMALVERRSGPEQPRHDEEGEGHGHRGRGVTPECVTHLLQRRLAIDHRRSRSPVEGLLTQFAVRDFKIVNTDHDVERQLRVGGDGEVPRLQAGDLRGADIRREDVQLVGDRPADCAVGARRERSVPNVGEHQRALDAVEVEPTGSGVGRVTSGGVERVLDASRLAEVGDETADVGDIVEPEVAGEPRDALKLTEVIVPVEVGVTLVEVQLRGPDPSVEREQERPGERVVARTVVSDRVVCVAETVVLDERPPVVVGPDRNLETLEVREGDTLAVSALEQAQQGVVREHLAAGDAVLNGVSEERQVLVEVLEGSPLLVGVDGVDVLVVDP